jgi:hypothetical protein
MKTAPVPALAHAHVEEVGGLAPLDAVTSDGGVKETELESAPLAVSKARFLAVEAVLGSLDEMQTGISLNAKYREFDAIGEVVRGVFLGIKTIYKGRGAEQQAIRSASWIDAQKNTWLNASKILVTQLEEVPVGTPIEIIFTQKIKMELGFAKEFDVRPLH